MLFDLIVIGVLALAVLTGLFKGLMRPLLRLAQLVLVFGLSIGAVILASTVLPAEEGETTNSILLVAVFFVMFIFSIIVTDFIWNKIVYGKHKFKKMVWDKVLGILFSLIFAVAIIWAMFAIFGTLAGSEYDLYALIIGGEDSLGVAQFFYNWNPLSFLTDTLVEAGIGNAIINLLNMFIG